jgi:hypothetical protein
VIEKTSRKSRKLEKFVFSVFSKNVQKKIEIVERQAEKSQFLSDLTWTVRNTSFPEGKEVVELITKKLTKLLNSSAVKHMQKILKKP